MQNLWRLSAHVAEYFSQFGKVTKVRLSRSKKSGKSKHYAFLEFTSPEVAAIASEAMDGYMLFTQKLVSRVLPVEEVHPDLFKGANRVFKQVGAARQHDGAGAARDAVDGPAHCAAGAGVEQRGRYDAPGPQGALAGS